MPNKLTLHSKSIQLFVLQKCLITKVHRIDMKLVLVVKLILITIAFISYPKIPQKLKTNWKISKRRGKCPLTILQMEAIGKGTDRKKLTLLLSFATLFLVLSFKSFTHFVRTPESLDSGGRFN